MKKDIAEAIQQAQTTKELTFSETTITPEIWQSIANISGLQEVVLTSCVLHAVPNVIREIKELKKLIIYARDATISDEIWPFVLSNTELEHLELVGCNLHTVPDKIGRLKNLKMLNLTNNQIETLPDAMSKLSVLENLTIMSNKLTEIPQIIFKIKSLKKLILSWNQISEVPPAISQLQQLVSLTLSVNPLKNISPHITRLPLLKEVLLDRTSAYGKQFDYIIETQKEATSQFLPVLNNLEINGSTAYKNQYFVALQTSNNTAFICLFSKLLGNVDFFDDINKEKYRYRLSIHVFGNENTKAEFLQSIRRHIDQNLKTIKAQMKIHRYFYFSDEQFPAYYGQFSLYNKFSIEIDYDKLLQHKAVGQDEYYSPQERQNIPVALLLRYIGVENPTVEKRKNSSGPITNVRIKNFKILKNIELQFSEQINILLGNNGLGKTSVLQALALGLLPTDNTEKPNTLSDYISIGHELAEITINWQKNGDERQIFVSPNSLIDRKMKPLPRFLLLAYGVNLNTRTGQDHTKIVNQLLTGKAPLHFTRSVFEDNYNQMHDPLTILKYLDDRLVVTENETKETFKEKILNGTARSDEKTTIAVRLNNLLFKTLNNYLKLVEKEEQIEITYHNEEQRYYFADINQTSLEIQHLSEGYKDHVLLITDILVKMLAARNTFSPDNKPIDVDEQLFKTINAVVLIDEFDRHLHPSWQRKLLSKLKADFSHTQFVLTTHNPMSILDREGHEIIQLITDTNRQIVANRHQTGTKYTDISLTYLKYFVNNVVSRELSEDLAHYNELLIENKEDGEEFRQLENKLETAYAGKTVRDVRYWKFLDFLRRFPQTDPVKNKENPGEWEFTEEEWNQLIEELEND